MKKIGRVVKSPQEKEKNESPTMLEYAYYYYKFLLEYLSSEYIALDNKVEIGGEAVKSPKNLAELFLKIIVLFKESVEPSFFEGFFEKMDSTWVRKYKATKNLNIPKILGQILKLYSLINSTAKFSFEEKNLDFETFLNNNPKEKDWDVYLTKLFIIVKDPDEMPFDYDDRVDFNQIEEILTRSLSENIIDKNYHYNKIKNNWNSVVIIVDKSELSELSGSSDQLSFTRNYLRDKKILYQGEEKSFCCTENFIDQPYIGHGSGCFFNQNTVVSAFHIFEGTDEATLSNYYFVQSYQLPLDEMNDMVFIDKKHVYEFDNSGTAYGKGSDTNLDEDWILIPVKPAFAPPLRYDEPASIPGFSVIYRSDLNMEGLQLYWIGHTLGLPKKYGYDGEITNNSYQPYVYFTSLDIYNGNSGSPVFDANSHLMVGIISADMGRDYEDGLEVSSCDGVPCLKIKTSTINQGYLGCIAQRLENIYKFFTKKNI